MKYIWTLDAHELWGPFPTVPAAHAYANHRSRFRAYTVLGHEELRPYHWESFRHYLDLAADQA